MNKKLKINTTSNEDVRLVRKLIIILIIVVIVAVGFFFLTNKIVDPVKEEEVNAEINYDVATVGTMFNRPYKEYYVLLYDSTLAEATYYNTLYSQYKNANKVKIYYVDLSLKNNKEYVQKEANKKLTGVNDASFKGTTLVKIKNGKVTTYLDSKEKIRAELDYSAE